VCRCSDAAIPLISSAGVYSIKRITPGLGNTTTNITIYSLVLISVGTNRHVSLTGLPLLHPVFAFCLELKLEERKKPEGPLKMQTLSYLPSNPTGFFIYFYAETVNFIFGCG